MAEDLPQSPDFRGLFEAISDHADAALFSDLLAPWLRGADGARARDWLAALARREGAPIPPASDEDLFVLYALSRVNEALLAGFQPARAGGGRSDGAPAVSLDEYVAFMTGLGLEVVGAAAFTPFLDEIVTVEPDERTDAPIRLAREYWPALMLSQMLVSRAGVAVSGGRGHVRKEIAETSTLYWAFRRKNRPRNDLSLGWGSNSQWATAFRRDYRIGGRVYLNVDGAHDLLAPPVGQDRDGLTRPERIELLIHRCFIVTDKPSEDLWPFDDTATFEAGGGG